MLPTLSWIDYSDNDRRRMLGVIRGLDDQDTRDELGIGSIRDALADILFPGTSTIQTGVKYFLFVPWIYQRREERQTSPRDVAARLREDEMALITALKAGGEGQGVIGIDAGRALKRLPSSIYWNGLRRWGIRRVPGSQAEYHRSLAWLYSRRRSAERNDDREPITDGHDVTWDPGLPPPESGFLNSPITLSLNVDQAVYLKERILCACPSTLLAHMVGRDDASTLATFAWEHPVVLDLPASLRRQLHHAQRFSEVMHGAILLYNAMMAEKGNATNLPYDYVDLTDKWSSDQVACLDELAEWSLPDFWRLLDEADARIPASTRLFVEAWIGVARALPATGSVGQEAHARQLISDREWHLKRQRARLHNPRHLEIWSGASGMAALDFRWSTARPMLAEIQTGLP